MSSNEMGTWTYRESASWAMRRLLTEYDDTIIMGQGVSDPIGIFGTTQGLCQTYGKNRVLEMPIAEDSMMGMAIGLSLNGFYPIQTHIRVDFLILALNQLVNSAAKYHYMYGGAFRVPMLIRAIIGRSWGQGPQHSQSLQAVLSQFPGLQVIMPSSAESLQQSYMDACKNRLGPVVSLEHRLLYEYNFSNQNSAKINVGCGASVVRAGEHLTIVASSIMVLESLRASRWVLNRLGVSCEVIDLHDISNININCIVESLNKTRRLIIADTGYENFGVAAEIIRLISLNAPDVLIRPPKTIALPFCPTPTSHTLERVFYPSFRTVVENICEIVSDVFEFNEDDMPSDVSAETQFKGPF